MQDHLSGTAKLSGVRLRGADIDFLSPDPQLRDSCEDFNEAGLKTRHIGRRSGDRDAVRCFSTLYSSQCIANDLRPAALHARRRILVTNIGFWTMRQPASLGGPRDERVRVGCRRSVPTGFPKMVTLCRMQQPRNASRQHFIMPRTIATELFQQARLLCLSYAVLTLGFG